MRAYGSFFRVRFISGLQYRAAAWGGLATQFAWGFMLLLLYGAFYKSDPAAFPMARAQLSNYIWLQQAFFALFFLWFFDKEVLEAVSSGSVAYELCRPADIYAMWYVRSLSMRLSSAALRCLPVLIIAALLPAPYGLSLPASLFAGLLFPVSMALGALVLVSFAILLHIAGFYTVSSTGLRIIATTVGSFLAGELLPLSFFPESVKTIVYLLPFASVQNTPFQIYNGTMSGRDASLGLLLQIFWLAALLTVGKLLMSRALRKVVVQGG